MDNLCLNSKFQAIIIWKVIIYEFSFAPCASTRGKNPESCSYTVSVSANLLFRMFGLLAVGNMVVVLFMSLMAFVVLLFSRRPFSAVVRLLV